MPSEERLIDANALLATETFSASSSICKECENEYRLEVMNAPTVDAVKVVHSSWILNDDGSGTCKHCNRTTKSCWDFDNQMHYCPNCGAKMDLEESNNDD